MAIYVSWRREVILISKFQLQNFKFWIIWKMVYCKKLFKILFIYLFFLNNFLPIKFEPWNWTKKREYCKIFFFLFSIWTLELTAIYFYVSKKKIYIYIIILNLIRGGFTLTFIFNVKWSSILRGETAIFNYIWFLTTIFFTYCLCLKKSQIKSVSKNKLFKSKFKQISIHFLLSHFRLPYSTLFRNLLLFDKPFYSVNQI